MLFPVHGDGGRPMVAGPFEAIGIRSRADDTRDVGIKRAIGDVVKSIISDQKSMITGMENYILGRDYNQ